MFARNIFLKINLDIEFYYRIDPFAAILWQIPVGRATLGRIMNVIGEPIDERGDISKKL